jgi:hypothetical protein
MESETVFQFFNNPYNRYILFMLLNEYNKKNPVYVSMFYALLGIKYDYIKCCKNFEEQFDRIFCDEKSSCAKMLMKPDFKNVLEKMEWGFVIQHNEKD